MLIGAFALNMSGVQAYDKEALAGWFAGLKPEKVVYAVNCGGIDTLTDLQGVTYKAVKIYHIFKQSIN